MYLKFHYFLSNVYNMFLAALLHKANHSMAAPKKQTHWIGKIYICNALMKLNFIPNPISCPQSVPAQISTEFAEETNGKQCQTLAYDWLNALI